ncbi:2'-5' RNA ligase family protein [Streptomyces bauhiniae]|uniref:2'-5' RNA ligase family protein n=1 Tax=Streptomyces bauhiniae TaxID=2340725 RepID=UPI001ABF6D24|nr:2'-5' RNA ligase family protein [Streptomyces bauhiniae]
MRTVELLPDEATEARVRWVWGRLSEAGMPSLAGHRHTTNRPHLTLTTASELPWDVRPALAGALSVLPLPLRLEGTLRFEGRTSVLAWRVVTDAGLTALQRRVWELLPGAGNPVFEPENWVPHLSLGRTRSGPDPWPAELLPAELSEPWEGRFTAARSYDTESRTVERLT